MDGDEGPLLPGSGETTARRGVGFGAVAAGGVIAAMVLGLGAGAIWGLSGRPSSAPPVVPYVVAPTTPAQSPTTPVAPTTPTDGTPTPTGPAGFPPAPASSSQDSDGWHVGRWRITNTGGTIGMVATVTNRGSSARSGNLTMYLYVAGTPLARLTAAVPDTAPGASRSVTFASQDAWGPGTKTLLLVAAP